MLDALFGRKKAAPAPTKPLPHPAQILKSTDVNLRAEAAAHPDALPEVLFVLAGDPAVEVRRNVAGNPATPSLVAPALAKDEDVDVRTVLLHRLVALLPNLSAAQHTELYQLVLTALETLAKDHVRHVREALANTLKDVAFAPPTVVKTLAQDVEQSVAGPVLQLCASLTDEDLLDVIARHPVPWTLAAIAGRSGVSASVSNAIVDTGDVRAGSILLDNNGATIEDDTLSHMVDRSASVTDWQARLAARPNLPRRLAVRLAELVDATVLALLEKRRDFDGETRRDVLGVTRRRLDYLDQVKTGISGGDRAAALFKAKRLTEDLVMDALSWDDRPFFAAALALRAGTLAPIVEKIFAAQSGKAITALAWKAKLSMRAALRLQQVAGVTGRDMVNARGGEAYPLSEADMAWQLEFFGISP